MNASDMMSRLVSHALAAGLFESVNKHEPKKAPGTGGLSAAIWVQNVDPIPTGSGLAATTVRVEFSVRIYSSMLQEPQDSIDPAIVHAVDVLITKYSADFTLGGTIRMIDLLGQFGVPLSAEAGYLQVDQHMFRVMTITVPLIVDDAYTQAP